MTKDNLLHNLEKFVAEYPAIYKFLKKCKVGYQTLKYHLFKLFGKDEELIYNRAFFNKNLEWNIPIASAVADILISFFHPKSVVDIGCGNAEFLNKIQAKGVEIFGFEGSQHAIDSCQVDKRFIQKFDLREVIFSERKYDLALCLEVAEHIESKFSARLVENVTLLSDTVVFTAAGPGQGGHFHINEKPAKFWIGLFLNRGFAFEKELTQRLKDEFKNKNILKWYSDNLMIFKRYQDV